MRSVPEKMKDLRLVAMSQHYPQVLQEAANKNLPLAQAVEWLLDVELESRHQQAIRRRFHFSRLHAQTGIDQFNFQHHKSRAHNKAKILRLLELEFIAQGANVVLVGNPGTGKTFLAKILGWQACQAKYKVLFTTAMDMLNQLIASQADHSLARKLKFYTDPDLLLCDELGYLALDQPTSNLFFQVISGRHSRSRSTLITTNTPFSEWGNILYNTTIATAIVDRLVENSHILVLEGESLRKLKKSQKAPS
jgi:DNA replication protein DnaC